MEKDFQELYNKYKLFTIDHSSTIKCCLFNIESRRKLLTELGINYLAPNGMDATIYLNRLEQLILKNG